MNSFDPSGCHTSSRHEFLTRHALQPQEGPLFSEKAVERIVKGNLLVDTLLPGNTAFETRAHAMRGFVQDSEGNFRLQTVAEAKQETTAFIELATESAVALAKAGKIGKALEAFGMATHAAQDVLQHNYDPWKYRGLMEAYHANAFTLAWHGAKDLAMSSAEELLNVTATLKVANDFRRGLREAGGEELLRSVTSFEED